MSNHRFDRGYRFQILQEKFPECEDAFWYYGEDIAKVDFPSGRQLCVMASGEIRISFEENGTAYKNQQAVDKAIELGLTDKDLDKIGEFDGWHNNNWFVVREYDMEGNMIGDDLGICWNYEDAIQMLEDTAENKIKELYG